MHLTHIKLKPTKKINKDFDMLEAVEGIELPEKSKLIAKDYIKTKKLSDDIGYDLAIEFDDSIIFGFDILHNGKRLTLPELNPALIFYSNAIMSHRNLIRSREILFEQSPTSIKFLKPIDPKIFGTFFQFATNCIINLQATVESFVNYQIPNDYQYIDKNGEKFNPSIFHKLDKVLPEIKKTKIKKRDTFRVRKIIELRNEIIHLTPSNEITNTQYKSLYRKILKFDFSNSILAVKKLINFYEPNLIEECACGKEYFYDLSVINKK